MRAVLLGTAAGGGVPQWNCACPTCESARQGAIVSRTQDCLAVSADGARWYLVNASPDIRTQITHCAALRPGPGPRETPVEGVLLTDGELDHTLGLVQLKEAEGLRVWAPDAVARTVVAREVVGHYRSWEWCSLDDPGRPVWLGSLRVDVLPVSAKRPRYAAAEELAGPWVVAYRITDVDTGGALVYAPCLRSWPEEFERFCEGADYVLLDGSFYAPTEMSASTDGDVGSAAQRAMGHVPMAGPDGSLARIRAAAGDTRWLYTHLNNTNPVLDPSTPEHADLLAAGADLAPEAAELIL